MPIVFTKDIETARKFYSIYKKIPGMSDEYLKNKISVAVSNEAITQERIPREILKQNSLCSYKEALTKLHFPNSLKDIEEANYRIEFESLLYFCAKLEQIKEDKVDHIVKNSLTLFGTVAGIVLTVWGTNKTLKFEETGTITTSAGRAFIKNLFSKR